MTGPRALFLGAALVIATAVPANAVVPASSPSRTQKSVVLVLVARVSFEELMGVPQMRDLARAGGAGLMSSPIPVAQLLSQTKRLPITIAPFGIEASPSGFAQPTPQRVGEIVLRTVTTSTGGRDVLVLVMSPSPSKAMADAGDEVAPIVMAQGVPGQLFTSNGTMHTLTSDSTRRSGVVTEADVVATILDFIGRPVPSSIGGSPIRVVDAPPPLALHAKHLANRRMTVPVQTAAALYVTIAGLFCAALIALRRRTPQWLLRFGSFVALTVGPLAVALLLAGHLPTLSYATVVPFVVAVTIAGTLAFWPLRGRFGVLAVPAGVGAAALAALVVESAVSWTAALTPFLGGSELDGGRFYGLPNVFIGLLFGAGLYVAQRLKVIPGALLLLLGGLFAGWPSIGANLGGAVSLFAGGGLWLAVRRWGRVGIVQLAVAGLVTLAGTAVVLVANAIASTPTHITHFEQTSGGSISDVWHKLVDRLGVGVHLIAHNPAALVPTVGTLVALAVALRPPTAIREAFERHREWRDAIVVILLTSIVSYLVNDSGPAAAGLGFGLGVGGMLYVALAEEPGKMVGA